MLTLPRFRLFNLLIVTALYLTACLPPATPAAPIPRATLAPPSTSTPFQPATSTQTAALPPPTATHTPLPTETETITPTPRPVTRRVLIISIDGLRPDAIALAPMPNLQALMQIGAYTLTAQTIFPSATLPAHTAMLTGLCPAKNGVDWNDYLPEKGYAKGTDLFDLAHAAGLKTAMFVGKEKLRQITEPSSTDIFRYINDRDTVIAQRITEEFPVDFGVMFVHFATPDAMGHVYGWMTPQYISVVQHADEAIGTLLKDLDDHGLRQDTLVIITADHGGHEQTHGSRMAEDMTIPWVVSGPGVRPGPLTTPIQTTDTAATAAWALGLPRPPEWDGWPVFEAFGQPIQPRPVPFCE
jgi:arylsulfatase A-like enzyme